MASSTKRTRVKMEGGVYSVADTDTDTVSETSSGVSSEDTKSVTDTTTWEKRARAYKLLSDIAVFVAELRDIRATTEEGEDFYAFVGQHKVVGIEAKFVEQLDTYIELFVRHLITVALEAKKHSLEPEDPYECRRRNFGSDVGILINWFVYGWSVEYTDGCIDPRNSFLYGHHNEFYCEIAHNKIVNDVDDETADHFLQSLANLGGFDSVEDVTNRRITLRTFS